MSHCRNIFSKSPKDFKEIKQNLCFSNSMLWNFIYLFHLVLWVTRTHPENSLGCSHPVSQTHIDWAPLYIHYIRSVARWESLTSPSIEFGKRKSLCLSTVDIFFGMCRLLVEVSGHCSESLQRLGSSKSLFKPIIVLWIYRSSSVLSPCWGSKQTIDLNDFYTRYILQPKLPHVVCRVSEKPS